MVYTTLDDLLRLICPERFQWTTSTRETRQCAKTRHQATRRDATTDVYTLSPFFLPAHTERSSLQRQIQTCHTILVTKSVTADGRYSSRSRRASYTCKRWPLQFRPISVRGTLHEMRDTVKVSPICTIIFQRYCSTPST